MVRQPQAEAAPVVPRSNGPRREIAAAGRTDIPEDGLDAVGAVRAFIAADSRVRGGRWKVAVTELAVRPKFQHGSIAPVASLLEKFARGQHHRKFRLLLAIEPLPAGTSFHQEKDLA